MSEPQKRGLRERPRKRNFDSQNDEGQLYPYTKTYQKEFVNPSQQLNQDAKMLLKFINTINRSYNEAMLLKSHKQTAKLSQNGHSKIPKKEEANRENGKKKQDVGRTIETEHVRKGKQMNSNSGQNKNYQKISNNKGEDFLTKIKGMALASASSMLELQKTLGKSQTNGSYPKKGTQNASLSKNKIDPASYFVVKGKQKTGGQQKNSNKFQLTQQKIFKRSAYHVAIAYHIFLSQKGKGVLDHNSYDPTYPARKLKQQMNRRPN